MKRFFDEKVASEGKNSPRDIEEVQQQIKFYRDFRGGIFFSRAIAGLEKFLAENRLAEAYSRFLRR